MGSVNNALTQNPINIYALSVINKVAPPPPNLAFNTNWVKFQEGNFTVNSPYPGSIAYVELNFFSINI